MQPNIRDESRPAWLKGPVAIRSDRDPIDLIAEDHWRQRAKLAELAAFAAMETPDPQQAAALLDWMRSEVAVHTRDEDDDLLPLLRRRAAPEDEAEALIGRLGAEHADAARRAEAVRQALERAARPSARLADPERALIACHVAAELRHLIFENAVILPLARARLTASDRRSLALRMAARRGCCLWPRETGKAPPHA